MLWAFPLKIQKYTTTTDTWEVVTFPTKEEFTVFVQSCFKLPGQYNLKNTAKWQEVGNVYSKSVSRPNFEGGRYHNFVKGSSQQKKWSATQKERVLNGVIYDDQYIPPFYYWYLNFCPIYNDVIKKKMLGFVWDSDLWFFQYIMLCLLLGKHAVVVKARQRGYSFKIMSLLYWSYCWFEGSVNTIGAYKEEYTLKSWRFLEFYRKHINTNTPWKRGPTIAKSLEWYERTQTQDGNYIGLDSKLAATTFKVSPENGVGGSCHPKGTKILMASGDFKSVEDIKIGEYILGIDNKPKKVRKLFNGFKDIYRVTPKRGDSYRTTGDHLLYLINRDKNIKGSKERLIKTEDWNNLSHHQKNVYVGVRNNKALEYSNEEVCPEIDPYFIGVWLGDGYRSNNTIIVNKTRDIEIFNYLQEFADNYGLKYEISRKDEDRYRDEMYHFRFPISERNGINSLITNEFVKYNLYYNKHIPDTLLKGSVETRRQLLAGIIDTDGYFNQERGFFVVTAKCERFAKQITQLARSLGAICKNRKVASKEYIVNGKKVIYSETNEIKCHFTDCDIIPTKVERKKNKRIPVKAIHTSPIERVEKIEYGEYFGIECEDHLYYLEDLTITHNCTIFFYEEAGIAPTILQTVGFVRPALEKGNRTTGLIILSGAVGDLDDCEGLKEVFYNPKGHNFLPVKNVWDIDPEFEECGLFVSEAYNLEGFIDKEGNSLVTEATAFIEKAIEEVKKNKRKDLAQLDISQKPLSPKAAFDQRKISEFPVEALQRQQERIKLKEQTNAWLLKPVKCLLYEDDDAKVRLKTTDLPQEHGYPIKPDWEDKRGVVTIYEPPEENAKWLTYFAGVDTVEVDSTSTSESIMTVDIYKRTTKEKYTDDKGKTHTRFIGGKIVATYRGRYNPVEKGNEQAWYLIKLYNAFSYVERSKPNFINYMKRHGRSRYLAKESDVPIYKDLNLNSTLSSSNYGFHLPSKDDKNSRGQVWKALKDSVKEYFSQEFDRLEKEDGEVIKIYTGIDRIDDYWMLEEYIKYNDKGNFDRVISSAAAITIGKVYEDQMGIPTIDNTKKEESPQDTYKAPRTINMLGGQKNQSFGVRPKKKQSLL